MKLRLNELQAGEFYRIVSDTGGRRVGDVVLGLGKAPFRRVAGPKSDVADPAFAVTVWCESEYEVSHFVWSDVSVYRFELEPL